jgi:hypothetical protein
MACPQPARLLSLSPITEFPPTKNYDRNREIVRECTKIPKSHLHSGWLTRLRYLRTFSAESSLHNMAKMERRCHPLPHGGAKPGVYLRRCSFIFYRPPYGLTRKPFDVLFDYDNCPVLCIDSRLCTLVIDPGPLRAYKRGIRSGWIWQDRIAWLISRGIPGRQRSGGR